MFLLYFVQFLIVGAMAQFPGTGPCKDLPIVENFDIDQHSGTWYIYETYPLFEPYGKCKQVSVTKQPDGLFLVDYKQIIKEPGNPVHDIQVHMRQDGPSSFTVIDGQCTPYYNHSYDVIAQDPDFFIKGKCENVGPSSQTYVWIKTKERHPSESVIKRISEAVKKSGLLEEYLVKIDQDNCPDDF